MRKRLALGIVVFSVLQVSAEQERASIPENVPELLRLADGRVVTSVADWDRLRRPEIVRMLCEQEYGVRPVERPEDLSLEALAADEEAFGGKCIRKRIWASYTGPFGKGTIDFSAWIPKLDHPVAAFVHSAPRPAETATDIDGPRPVYWLPAEEIVSRGYAAVAYCNQDVAVDWRGPDVPLNAGSVGYHLRTGVHDIIRYDWQCYIDFADGHGWHLPRGR